MGKARVYPQQTFLVENLMGDVSDEFDVEFKGAVDGRTFLGREVEHDPESGRLVVRVKAQIAKALKKHDLEDLKPLHLPIQPDARYVEHVGDAVRKDEYLSAVGSLIFIATTRPDVQFAVGIASRFSSCPGHEHWALVTRIFAYLSVTRNVGLSVGLDRSDGSGLLAYVDADHAGNVGSRRSTTGVAVFLDGTLISSTSKRQATVALSTFVAELNAVAKGVTDLEWYESILRTLPIGSDTPIRVHCDNKSSVDALLSPTFVETRKANDIKVKYVREQVERGFVDLKWINGADNVADLLTKALPAKVAKAHGETIGLVGFPVGKSAWGSR